MEKTKEELLEQLKEIEDQKATAIKNQNYELAQIYRDWETDRKSTRLNSSHITRSRMPSSA